MPGLIRFPRMAHLTLVLSRPPYIFAFALNFITYGMGISDGRGYSYVHVLSSASCLPISSFQVLSQYSASGSRMDSSSDLSAGGGGLIFIFCGKLFLYSLTRLAQRSIWHSISMFPP